MLKKYAIINYKKFLESRLQKGNRCHLIRFNNLKLYDKLLLM